MKKALLYTIGLLFACCLQAIDRSTIKRHLQEKDDTKAMRHILNELEYLTDAEIDSFVNQFISICTKQKREYLKNQVVIRLYVASTPKEPTDQLLAMMRKMGVLVGDRAPNFEINDSTKLYDVLGEQTLLFFNETSCSLCHDELDQLRLHYEILEEQGVQLISIDCNIERATFQPWQYNLADPIGAIYHPYGVLTTPTYILLDGEGTILKRVNKLMKVNLL